LTVRCPHDIVRAPPTLRHPEALMPAPKKKTDRRRKPDLSDLRKEVRQLVIQERLETVLGDFEEPQLSAIDAEVRRFIIQMGAETQGGAPLLTAIKKHFGWSKADFEGLDETSASLTLEADAAYAIWATANDDLEILDPTPYRESGNYAPWGVTYRRHDDRKMPDNFGGLVRYEGDPVWFRAALDMRNGVWQAMARGAAADRFLAAWESRTERFIVDRFRGKALDMNFQPIDLKTYSREDLIYPKRLGRRIDEMLTSFGSWAADEGVPRWGYVLIGGPGTGKTTIGGLLAGAKPPEVTFLYCPAGKIEKVSQIERLFRMARLLSPTILQIDDIDLISADRTDDDEYTSCLMENLDGLEAGARIFTVFTTNDPSGMDEAIINRAGRTSGKIVFGGFGECFEGLLAKFVGEYRLRLSPADVKSVAKTMRGRVSDFTPDEVKNVCQRLSLLHRRSPVTRQALRAAIEATHEAFHGDAADSSYVRRRRRSGEK
jgi:hypothetical protein